MLSDPVDPPGRRLDALVQLVPQEKLGKPSALQVVEAQLLADVPEILRLYEEIGRIAGRLRAYAFLWHVEDTQNTAALNLQGRVDQAQQF